jgi:flagellar basal-body rod modification protein FlgD
MQVGEVTVVQIGPVSSGSTSAAETSSSAAGGSDFSVPGGKLGQNAFLQLLATQLEYQNPLQPENNTQFIAQLAQFSSLEQMTNVSSEETQVVQGVSQVGQSVDMSAMFSLLGDTVTLNTSAGAVSGQVSGVSLAGSAPTITVNGQSYPLADVQSVTR